MGKHKTYTAKQRRHVEYLGSKGIGDTQITKETNVAYSVVQNITTSYWNNLMKLKKL